MTAIVKEASGVSGACFPALSMEDRAKNRFAAHRATAAARADVPFHEAETLSRAAAESLAQRRRERTASERLASERTASERLAAGARAGAAPGRTRSGRLAALGV